MRCACSTPSFSSLRRICQAEENLLAFPDLLCIGLESVVPGLGWLVDIFTYGVYMQGSSLIVRVHNGMESSKATISNNYGVNQCQSTMYQ